MKRLKQSLIPLICVGFIGQLGVKHWREIGPVLAHRPASSWGLLGLALGVTLVAHLWAGWLWSLLLMQLEPRLAGASRPQSARHTPLVRAYLITNLAKYLPGNIWHYVGRVKAAQAAGASLGGASLSVALEPLLMAAAALSLVLMGSWAIPGLAGARAMALGALVGLLGLLHPRWLNPLAGRLNRKKLQKSPALSSIQAESVETEPVETEPVETEPVETEPVETQPVQLTRYPWPGLVGEALFVVLRGVGFLLVGAAIAPVLLSEIPQLLAAFWTAWLLGLVVPGAPGGLGVFEATLLTLLQGIWPPAQLLTLVGAYRLISLLAEVGGAGLAGLQRLPSRVHSQ
jgi:glycosyltransferase 2 family protein